MIKIGAHQSVSGGYFQAIKRVKNIGGNCLQIFSTSPRSWQPPQTDIQQIEEFIKIKKKFAINPVYFHTTYLINLADDGRIGRLSKQFLIAEIKLAERAKIKGIVVHLGSYKNKEKLPLLEQNNDEKYQVLIRNIKEVLSQIPNDVYFIIENAGNRKIGQNLEEIGKIVNDIKDKQLKICLDTCHLFAAGYKFSNKEELDSFLNKFDELIGLEKLELWHINDSRDHFWSFRDRHQNIGEGTIGIDEFKTLLNHPRTKNYPFILETPGFDGNGPDKKNIDILKGLISSVQED